jgi:hypothetical protein
VVPAISGVSPNSASNSAQVDYVVSGSNFALGAVVVFDNTDLATSYTPGGNLQATLPAGQKTPGTYTIYVRNPDGTVSATTTVVITGLVTPTAVPSNGSGPLLIDAKPFPNPNPRELRVLLGQSADRIVVKVYSRAMVLIGVAETAGPLGAGWQRVSLPTDGFGHCFFTVTATRSGAKAGLPKAGSFVRF